MQIYPEETEDVLMELLDLMKGLLTIDLGLRMTPGDILQHPFVSLLPGYYGHSLLVFVFKSVCLSESGGDKVGETNREIYFVKAYFFLLVCILFYSILLRERERELASNRNFKNVINCIFFLQCVRPWPTLFRRQLHQLNQPTHTEPQHPIGDLV